MSRRNKRALALVIVWVAFGVFFSISGGEWFYAGMVYGGLGATLFVRWGYREARANRKEAMLGDGATSQ